MGDNGKENGNYIGVYLLMGLSRGNGKENGSYYAGFMLQER